MKLLKALNLIVFLSAAILVISVFYEGLTLTWYSFVTILLLATDGFFVLATILNLFLNRKIKIIFYLNIFSIIIIAVAFITKFLDVEHPKWAVTIWYLYILIFYGIQIIPNIFDNIRSKVQLKNNKRNS